MAELRAASNMTKWHRQIFSDTSIHMALLVKSLNGKSYEEILCFNNIKKLNKIDNNYPKDTLTLNC